MQKIYGIDSLLQNPQKFYDLTHIKRNALLFDSIVVNSVNATLLTLSSLNENSNLKAIEDELILLKEKNIIVDAYEYMTVTFEEERLSKEQKHTMSAIQDRLDSMREHILKIKPSESEYVVLMIQFNNLLIRNFALGITYSNTRDLVVPILSSFGTDAIANVTTKQLAYNVVVKNLPYPNDETSWNQIIEFKEDNDSRRKFLALKVWLNKMVRTGISVNEMDEELNHLLAEYEHHFNIHKMKYTKGTFKTIVMGLAEAAENMARLKFSKVAEMAFSISEEKLNFLEGEARLPGSEVAYLYTAKETFGS